MLDNIVCGVNEQTRFYQMYIFCCGCALASMTLKYIFFGGVSILVVQFLWS